MKTARDYNIEVWNEYWKYFDYYDKHEFGVMAAEWLEIVDFQVDEDIIKVLLDEFAVYEEAVQRTRWSDCMISIIQLGDRYFRLEWNRGLTEYQDNYYFNKFVEVEMIEKVITQTVIEWKEKSKC